MVNLIICMMLSESHLFFCFCCHFNDECCLVSLVQEKVKEKVNQVCVFCIISSSFFACLMGPHLREGARERMKYVLAWISNLSLSKLNAYAFAIAMISLALAVRKDVINNRLLRMLQNSSLRARVQWNERVNEKKERKKKKSEITPFIWMNEWTLCIYCSIYRDAIPLLALLLLAKGAKMLAVGSSFGKKSFEFGPTE